MMIGHEKPRGWIIRIIVALIIALSAPVRADVGSVEREVLRKEAELRVASVLPDLSGLAWIEGDLFVAVHDVKNPKGHDQPRVSLLKLPTSLDGLLSRPVQLKWPAPQGLSSDLECIARIPDTRQLLLVESGDDGGDFRRIFLANYNQDGLRLVDFIEWPTPVTNVEGTAVVRIGERLIFIYAERAHGQTSTQIRWAELELQPLRIGTFKQVTLTGRGPTGRSTRPVSALEADRAGRLYIASALDTGENNGPFRSMVWRIGQVTLDGGGNPQLILDAEPTRLATLDGMKVESIAIREQVGEEMELFVGVDDENYGGTLRLIPLLPEQSSGGV